MNQEIMTEQEKIDIKREEIKRWMECNMPCPDDPSICTEDGCEDCVAHKEHVGLFLQYLHSQGVVIRVDKPGWYETVTMPLIKEGE
jgi:hypothetical protein